MAPGIQLGFGHVGVFETQWRASRTVLYYSIPLLQLHGVGFFLLFFLLPSALTGGNTVSGRWLEVRRSALET